MLGECKRRVLPNGLRVIGVENRALHSFVCSVYAGVGSRLDPPGRTGLSHFLEHMLMQGSQGFPTSHHIARSVEALGGMVDAGTYAEYMNVISAVHRKHWERGLEITSDVLLRPLFDEREIEGEKAIILQEIAPYRDKEGRNISVAELAHGIFFEGRVSEAGTRGNRPIMQGFDRAAVRDHYESFFVPSNVVVCLSGGFESEQAFARVDEEFGAATGGRRRPYGPVPPQRPPAGRARACYRITEALPTVEALLCYRAYRFGDPRFDAARAVSHMLGAGLSSRLFTHVREELGLVYDIESHAQGYSDTGALEVSLTMSADNLVRAIEATLRVLRQAAADGFTQEELDPYKESVRCGMDMLCDAAGLLADWFGKQEVLLGPDGVATPRQYVRRQEALALESVNAVAREVITDADATLVAVGPFGQAECDALRRLLPAEEPEPGA